MKGRTRLVEWTSDPESQPHRKGFRTRSRLPAPWEGCVGVPQDLRAHPTLSPVEHLVNGATTSFWFRFVVHLSVEHEMSVFPCQCWQFLKVSSESYLNGFAYRRAIFRQIFMSLLKKAEMLRGGPMSSPSSRSVVILRHPGRLPDALCWDNLCSSTLLLSTLSIAPEVFQLEGVAASPFSSFLKYNLRKHDNADQ